MPSLTGGNGSLIISLFLEAKVLIDNHKTALRMCIAIRLRDKGWPNLLITVVAWGKPNQTIGLKLFDRNHFRKKKICKRRDGRSRDTIKSDIINNVGADEKTACGSAFGLNTATLHVVLLRNRLDQEVA